MPYRFSPSLSLSAFCWVGGPNWDDTLSKRWELRQNSWTTTWSKPFGSLRCFLALVFGSRNLKVLFHFQFKFRWWSGWRRHEWEKGVAEGRGGGRGGGNGEETGRAEGWGGGWAQTVCNTVVSSHFSVKIVHLALLDEVGLLWSVDSCYDIVMLFLFLLF